MNSLIRVLGLSHEDVRSMEKTVGRIRSVSDFLSDAVDAVKDLDFIEALQKASPWADAILGSANDAFPAVKFVTKLFGRLTGQNDPDVLALVAFTSVYQQSVNQAVRAIDAPSLPYGDAEQVKKTLRNLDDSLVADALDFSGLSIEGALDHPFITHADGMFAVAAEGAGYDAQQRLALQRQVHQRFVSALKRLLSHGDTAAKFEPLRRRLALGADEANAYAALARHAEYQRALFEEAPVFGKEAFPLAQIYIDSECGLKEWGPLNDGRDPQGRKLNAFDESCGGRQRIGETVLAYLRKPGFRDAIVIQGAAGAGKSAFTQWLSAELVRQDLTPIRILMRHIPFDRERPIEEALREAITYDDEDKQPRFPRPADPFLGRRIFKEKVDFHGVTISPYVLILDAWDEISMSVPQGFRVRLNKFLGELRSVFLGPNLEVPVRVILTGRPSVEVAESTFMQEQTPLLTLRPWNPDDLAAYFSKLAKAVNEPPLMNVEGTGWPNVDVARFAGATGQYRTEFEEMLKKGRSENTYAGSGSTLEILGMPLLAFLAARLLTEASEDAATALLENPTTLFRSLLDLTCSSSGRYAAPTDKVGEEAKFRGNELRDLLRHTASAMTVYGKENISYDELEQRLDLEGIQVQGRVNEDTTDHPLSQLIVSYYFKGGHTDLGCEFMHKSFREYLFAEEIVEALKKYGARNASSTLPQREPYWADFPSSDPRYDFARAMANRLSAQWLTPEVARNLGNLLKWEIERSAGRETATTKTVGKCTDPLSMEGWTSARDALADLWDWWGEGVHMRPQPTRDRNRPFDPPLALEVLLNRILPRVPDSRRLPEPPRINIVDSHLGDALFRLSAIVHFQVAMNTGWSDFDGDDVPPNVLWQLIEEKPRRRRCQILVGRGGGEWRMFAPNGERGDYWNFYPQRISGAGWRPNGVFPSGCDARGIFLRNANIRTAFSTNLSFSHLLHCAVDDAAIHDAELQSAYLVGLQSMNASFENVDFHRAILDECMFEQANFYRSSFRRAVISASGLMYGVVSMSSFDLATIELSRFVGGRVAACSFEEAVIEDVTFNGAELFEVTYLGATGVNLSGARSIRGVTLPDGTVTSQIPPPPPSDDPNP